MAFSARTISREMEVQMGKAPPCLNPFPMVNPLLPPLYFSPWSSMPAPVFQSGMSNGHVALDLFGGRKRGRKVVDMEYLFSKILTPSDVGTLNRLLIPRQCAEECFPKISEAKSGEYDDDFLNFEDLSTGLIWRFRFCLWNNSKTYFLTKGWDVFIKEKNLKKGDVLSFYRDVGKTASTNHLFIHIKPHTGTISLPHHVPCASYGIPPALKPLYFGSGELMPPTNLMQQQITFPESASVEIVRAEKHLRLFGVDIDIPSHDCGDESCSGLTKSAS